jgi:hypothetical protein
MVKAFVYVLLSTKLIKSLKNQLIERNIYIYNS